MDVFQGITAKATSSMYEEFTVVRGCHMPSICVSTWLLWGFTARTACHNTLSSIIRSYFPVLYFSGSQFSSGTSLGNVSGCVADVHIIYCDRIIMQRNKKKRNITIMCIGMEVWAIRIRLVCKPLCCLIITSMTQRSLFTCQFSHELWIDSEQIHDNYSIKGTLCLRLAVWRLQPAPWRHAAVLV